MLFIAAAAAADISALCLLVICSMVGDCLLVGAYSFGEASLAC
jgi:hypothetical protein